MQAIDEALLTLFTGDATLMGLIEGVYNTIAPEDEETGLVVGYPLAIFQQVAASDEYSLAGRIRASYLYQVRIAGEGGDIEALNDAAARIETLLMNTALVTGGLYCRREGQLPYMAEMDGGVIYPQVGATYRIEVQG